MRPSHDQFKEALWFPGALQRWHPATEHVLDALSRLKHAYDLGNAVPVLVRTPAKIGRARQVVRGSFHEIDGEIRIILWPQIRDLYDAKAQLKQLEAELRLF